MADAGGTSGRIIAAHGRHYMVRTGDGRVRKCFPRGKKMVAAVGDYVHLLPEGAEEGAITEVMERRNLLYRSDALRSKHFAANVDQVLIVLAVEPPFSLDLLGRALVATRTSGIKAVIILNKSDLTEGLAAARARLQALEGLEFSIIELSALDSAQVREILMPLLRDRTTLLLGQSGMGKSTLLNALVPTAQAHTQAHSLALGAGKHTTTSTRMYTLPGGAGELIDSPGFQAFGLQHLSPAEVQHGFPEFDQAIGQCRFHNCSHRHEPGCAVLIALEAGQIHPERHELYCRILAENEAGMRY